LLGERIYVENAPTLEELLSEIPSARLTEVALSSTDDGRYLHWDKLRRLTPPAGLTQREWWLGLKLSRPTRQLPLTDPAGQPAVFATPDRALRLLHRIDQEASGQITMPEVVTADDQARQHYLVNSLMEEAIRSSQLEGASTSRAVAKEMLQSGREPANPSERMIVNNYLALEYMREAFGDDLTPAHVLEMQRILTDGTLDNPDAAGRMQAPEDERIAVYDRVAGDLIHRPPPAEKLQERMERMCAFANAPADDGVFIHPVIRSILLHFWLGYDHPFEDGNGRTARLLFYWSMRKHGYWLTEYLSISRILRQGPSKYSRAFLLSEKDALDTTYFVLFHLEVIERAIRELREYLRRKVSEMQAVRAAIRGAELNHRQVALLNHAIQHPRHEYTYQSHARSHRVTHETARTDLLELHKEGFLDRRRAGRRHVFTPTDLSKRLATPSASHQNPT
jgi:Fic family protein